MVSIRTEALVKRFGAVRALDGVDLGVVPGELFFLLGASGCGKSTLLRCLAGLETPTSGQVYFDERNMTGVPTHRREAAMVFQSYALWPHLNVAENIAFGLVERRVPKDDIHLRVAEALERVQMAGYGLRSIDQLSGGQQQRVALARALVVRPKCLLLDEPLSNLDAQLRAEMRGEIRRIVKDHGLTAVYVTHDQEEALAMADRVAVLDQGRVAQIGRPEDIYQNPRSRPVARLTGHANELPGVLTGIDGRRVAVATPVGPIDGVLSDPEWLPQPGDAVCIMVRPESWSIGIPEEMPVENALRHAPGIPGRLRGRSFRGAHVQYEVETALGIQQVLAFGQQADHCMAAPVTLCVPAAQAIVIRP